MKWKGYDLVYAVKNSDGEYVGKNNALVNELMKANKYKQKQKAEEVAKRMNEVSISRYKVVKVHVILQEEEME